ncbi:MAG: ferritin-like domain-containing protein [Deltaproteobacteria bacterium]|nr:ferritin-like domain-containing protein [Deltaproteobacteria bacterium]
MKKTILVILLVLVMLLTVNPSIVQSQPGSFRGGYGMGPGMMGGWDSVDIPSQLPAPKNTEWVQKLRDILTLEKQSLTQYQADQEKFNAYMPYMMVIPQEENHIEWIGQLFKAYGLPADGKAAPVVENKTLTEAYELSVKMETDLLPRYEWLVKKAEDRDTAQVLNAILIQSRWHLVMFEHALRMGHGYGYSRGSGMMGGYGYGMGPGMMGGYGYGMGRGYGRQSQSTGKSIDAKEAEVMMKDYLKSSRNPNLKLGKIKDVGSAFEAEILTKKNALVDRVHIDKATGYIKSAY